MGSGPAYRPGFRFAISSGTLRYKTSRVRLEAADRCRVRTGAGTRPTDLCFIVRVTLGPSMGSAYPLDSVPLDGADNNSPTILVVEDDVFQRMTVAAELRKQGYNVVEAANADEALSILQSGTRIHVVFTDIAMPGSLDGVGLARIVCSAFPSVQVILTSGHLAGTELDDRISGFFPKPYDVQKLVAHIKSHFDSRRTPSPSAVVKS